MPIGGGGGGGKINNDGLPSLVGTGADNLLRSLIKRRWAILFYLGLFPIESLLNLLELNEFLPTCSSM